MELESGEELQIQNQDNILSSFFWYSYTGNNYDHKAMYASIGQVCVVESGENDMENIMELNPNQG